MNWISKKDKQMNLKRKHSNINILDKIASNDITHVFKPNDGHRVNPNLHRPEVKNKNNFQKLISKSIFLNYLKEDSNLGEQMKKIDNMIENMLNENYLKNNFPSQYL